MAVTSVSAHINSVYKDMKVGGHILRGLTSTTVSTKNHLHEGSHVNLAKKCYPFSDLAHLTDCHGEARTHTGTHYGPVTLGVSLSCIILPTDPIQSSQFTILIACR